jgi:hypothetical protein
MVLGDMFHQNMHARLEGRPLPYALADNTDREWPYLCNVVANWETPKDWQIIGVEKSLVAPFMEHEMMGRLDCLIIRKGGVWGVQWKTMAKGKSLANHQESVRLSFHEAAYQYLVQMNREHLNIGDLPYRGTILGTAVKQLKENGDGYKMVIACLPRTRNEQESLLQSIARIVDTMDKSDVYRNYNECIDSIYGRCQYYDACHAGIDINGPPFINLENRYKDQS